ncbi:MAG: M18 family aminopeptidase [Candidatus Eisenbacteria bacterium]
MAKKTTAGRLDGKLDSRTRAVAEDLLGFLDRSPSAYHAVASLQERLTAAGFVALEEDEPFSLKPGGRYLVNRRGSALAAFAVGAEPPSRGGFRMIGAHLDSPALKLKPRPEIVSRGLVHLSVEIYGGPILATWMDRDLGLCGRAVLASGDRKLEARLFASGRPVCGTPNVAVHMNRSVNDEGLKLNPQTQLTPILGSVAAGLPEKEAVRFLLGKLLGVRPERVIDFDAYLYDTQPSRFAGWEEEFILSGRLDDLAMCHAAVLALIEATGSAVTHASAPDSQAASPRARPGTRKRPARKAAERRGAGRPVPATRLVVCYDSEEIGSQTAEGARSTLVPQLLERIALAMGDSREQYFSALASSRFVSADNAHAEHPGFADRSEPQHAPRLNGGPVIKTHASRAYATDAYSAAFFEQACRRAGVPFQRFVNRSDAKSGSTIGSMAAAQLGVPTADVGSAQYAMHSIREMGGAHDPWFMTAAMRAFLEG